jgi:PRTRC genetic system protein C
MEVKEIKRVFVYDKQTLQDPNKNMSVERVADFYSDRYPEFVNTEIINKGINDSGYIEFEIKPKVGTKG